MPREMPNPYKAPLEFAGVPDIDPEMAYKAALTMAGIAAENDDLCGLSEVLEVLSIKEKALEHRTSPKKVQ